MKLINLVLLSLLCGCATSNYYDKTVNYWRGKNAAALIAKWGTPDQAIHNNDGSNYYSYTRTHFENFPYPSAPNFTNFVAGGTAYGAMTSNPEANYYPIHCTTTFQTNPHNIITYASYTGGDCLRGPNTEYPGF
jgi:hypothetical protein